MKTVFVTGGSGFLGRSLIRELIKKGYRVRALARSSNASDVVRKLGAEVVQGDLDQIQALQKGMEGCSTVFHSAAKTEDWGRWDDFFRINVRGTENVLTAAKNAHVSRFLHVSTEAVLVGGGPIHNADETRPLPRKKFGFYPRSKGMAEELVLKANTPEMATIIIRPRFIWGRDDTTVLPRFIEVVQKGQFAWIAGGHYPTSICHVQNVCEGAILAAEKGKGGEIYFLTDGPPIEFRRFIQDMLQTKGVVAGNRSMPRGLAHFVARLAEILWSVLPGSPPVSRTALYLMGEEVTVNDQKARQFLGYTASVSYEQGLQEMKS